MRIEHLALFRAFCYYESLRCGSSLASKKNEPTTSECEYPFDCMFIPQMPLRTLQQVPEMCTRALKVRESFVSRMCRLCAFFPLASTVFYCCVVAFVRNIRCVCCTCAGYVSIRMYSPHIKPFVIVMCFCLRPTNLLCDSIQKILFIALRSYRLQCDLVSSVVCFVTFSKKKS